MPEEEKISPPTQMKRRDNFQAQVEVKEFYLSNENKIERNGAIEIISSK